MIVVMDSDPGKRRRLPAWMLQASSEHKPSDSGKVQETCSMLEGQHEHRAIATGSKLRALSGKRRRSNHNADTESTGNLEITVKRQTKRRMIKETQNYAGTNALVTTCSAGNIKPQLRTEEDEITMDKKMSLKENRKLKRNKSSDPVRSPERNENEIDLTVEDLISIAQEYVNADKMKQQECSNVKESVEIRSSNSSVSLETNILRPLQSGSSKVLTKCTEARSSSNVNYVTSSEMNEKSNQGAENFVKSTTTTGDGAQAMLDLLLGPLLKKPPVIEQEPKEVILESALLIHDNDKQIRKDTWKALSITKKKSSLKNQVAMLLE